MSIYKDSKLISIIIPCYNSAKYLDKAIDSSINQTWKKKEIIIVDDGSTDNSIDIIKKYALKYPSIIKWKSQKNQGPSSARNNGFNMSNGNYIQWLDADDYLEKNKILPQVEYLRNHPNVGVVYSNWKQKKYSKKYSKYIVRNRNAYVDDVILEYLGGSWVPLHSYLMQRSAADLYRWDESLTVLEDYDYWLQIALRGVKFSHVYCDDCAVYMSYDLQNNRNTINEDWFKTNLYLKRKTIELLEEHNLMRVNKYIINSNKSFLGIARASYLHGYPEIGDLAVSEALKLKNRVELVSADFKLYCYFIFGVKRVLRYQVFFKRFREFIKCKIYEIFSFDINIKFFDNIAESLKNYNSSKL